MTISRHDVQVPPVVKWDKTEGAYVTVKPSKTVTVYLEIDQEAIARQLGQKANKSKRGKSIALGGLIKAMVKL